MSTLTKIIILLALVAIGLTVEHCSKQVVPVGGHGLYGSPEDFKTGGNGL